MADPNVVKALDSTSFDLEAFRQGEPMTIFLILPVTRLHSHGLLLRSWLSTLFSVAMSRKKMPKTQTGFWVDEVAAIGTGKGPGVQGRADVAEVDESGG